MVDTREFDESKINRSLDGRFANKPGAETQPMSELGVEEVDEAPSRLDEILRKTLEGRTERSRELAEVLLDSGPAAYNYGIDVESVGDIPTREEMAEYFENVGRDLADSDTDRIADIVLQSRRSRGTQAVFFDPHRDREGALDGTADFSIVNQDGSYLVRSLPLERSSSSGFAAVLDRAEEIDAGIDRVLADRERNRPQSLEYMRARVEVENWREREVEVEMVDPCDQDGTIAGTIRPGFYDKNGYRLSSERDDPDPCVRITTTMGGERFVPMSSLRPQPPVREGGVKGAGGL